MTIYKGSQNLVEIYKGNIKISEIYKGSQLIYTSSNWKTLTINSETSGDDSYLFTSNKHGLIIVNNNDNIIYKTDLNTVSVLGKIPLYSIDAAYYNNSNNKLLFIGSGDRTTSSFISNDDNLSTYDSGTLPENPQDFPYNGAEILGNIAFDNTYYVIGGFYRDANFDYRACVFYSTDGINWTRNIIGNTMSSSAEINHVCYGNNKFVAFGSSVFTAGDRKSLIATTPTTWSNYNVIGISMYSDSSMKFCNGYFFITTGSSYNKIYRSSDGITWTLLTSPTDFNANNRNFNIIFYNNLYYIVDDKNYIYSTADFTTYKKYKLPETKLGMWDRIGFCQYGDYIVICDGCKLYYSLIGELEEIV